MDTKTLCLGVLSLGEASGYEIKKLFEQVFGHFYVAGFGSIYPALADLTANGLVTVTDVEQSGRPDKKVYRLTDVGRMALQAELAAAPPRHKVRSEFLVLTFFARLLEPERLSEVLDERLAAIEAQLAGIRAVVAECPEPGPRFTAGFGLAVLTAARDYINQNRGWVERECATTAKDGQ